MWNCSRKYLEGRDVLQMFELPHPAEVATEAACRPCTIPHEPSSKLLIRGLYKVLIAGILGFM